MDPSPYRPPALTDEREPRGEQEPELPAEWPPLPLPLWGSAVFAAASLAVHVVATFSERLSPNVITVSIRPFLPPALLALFTLFCLFWYSAQPQAGSRSLGAKLLIALLVPPVSLLIFVPAFFAIVLLVVVSIGPWPLLMVSGLAGAYFLTAVGIARWLWWWFVSHR